jgi:transcriptional regulator with XRE-family HTH domain
MAAPSPPAVGPLLRGWRRRRNLSQMEVALTAAVSTRHLSFIETGRARPSREMVLHLAERLDVPLGERNALLLAAGYAPEYRERDMGDAEMAAVRDALGRFLAAHEPYPALVADRRCDIVMTNGALGVLLEGVAPSLLQPPANAMRIALHPDGMAPRIANLQEWSGHLLHVLRRRAEAEGDPELAALHDELAGLPGVDPGQAAPGGGAGVVVPLRLRAADGGGGELTFLSTTSRFGTALDVTLAGLWIEAFYPADEATAAALAGLALSPLTGRRRDA